MSRLVAFGYCGGKFYQLNWLRKLLPKCHHFVEPFCGSAIVTLNREPSKLETINDINGDIINFFRVLRNNGNELIEKLENTAYARQEFIDASRPTDDLVERARNFYVRAIQSFGGVLRSGWARRIYSPRGQSPANFSNAVSKLYLIRDRLQLVQIDNCPALSVIKSCDRDTTLFYCDPPYVIGTHNADVYGDNDMSDDDHRELALVLHNCKARVAISGHRCDLYDELYHDWHRHDKDGNYICINDAKESPSRRRTDSLWTNYEVSA